MAESAEKGMEKDGRTQKLVARPMVEVDPVGGSEKHKRLVYGDGLSLCVDEAAKPYST